jgi:hypothetical protein
MKEALAAMMNDYGIGFIAVFHQSSLIIIHHQSSLIINHH